jgi:hypothetical protein
MKVILEGPLAQGRGFKARTKYQAPEVDGVVIIEAGAAALKTGDPVVEVEITGADTYDLKGRWIP